MTAAFTRRAALAGLAAIGALGAVRRAAAQPAPSAGACVLTPRSTEGPFYFDPGLLRADVTEGRPGAPLELALQVVEARGCAPLPGALVEIWHADAFGAYSGYAGQNDGRSTRSETFLRGAQFADGDGRVRFRTIWPGWYPGRVTHVHFKVRLDARNLLTGQLYFPDEANRRIYASAPPYAARKGHPDMLNDADGLFRRGGSNALAAVEEKGDRHVASLTLGVDRS